MRGRINILFIITDMGLGGAERLVHSLVLGLDRKRFSPSIAWFNGNEALKEFVDLGVPLFHIPKTKRFDLSTMKRLGEIIRDNDIRIVNAHHFMPFFYSFYGAQKNSARLFYTAHSEWELRAIPLRWRKAGGFLLRRSAGAVAVSHGVADTVRNTFSVPPEKTFTILNGVDLESFKEIPDKTRLRERLGIAQNEIIFGMVANLKKVKNHLFLLKAFGEFIASRKDSRLLLVGQGFDGDPENSETEIHRFIGEQGLGEKVLLLGYRTDVAELLGAMDVFCLTSHREGLPICLIEAMAAGLPAIGTDVEGIRDVVSHGMNGFLVRPDDVDGLKTALLKLAADTGLRERFGRESREMAQRKYSLSRCLKEYHKLFISKAGQKVGT